MESVKKVDGVAMCDSSMIAKKFRVKHAYVINNCDKLLSDISKIKGSQYQPLIVKEVRSYRGTEYTAYLMGRELFTLLAMRFRGKDALAWQIEFNAAFYEMERAILNPPATMSTLNTLTIGIESRKNKASECGSYLQSYRKVKKDDEQKWLEAVDEAQATFNFTEE